MNRDYVFNINWEDRYKKAHRVGILAQLDEVFYLVLKEEKDIESAYKNGFIGISGFKPEEIYRGNELFDFFKARVFGKSKKSQCEELAQTKGISMIDSFSVEEVPEKVVIKYKELILKAYELQEKIKEEGKSKESKKPVVLEGIE